MKNYNELSVKKPEDIKVYLVNPPSPGDVKMIREGRCMQRSGVWTAIRVGLYGTDVWKLYKDVIFYMLYTCGLLK